MYYGQVIIYEDREYFCLEELENELTIFPLTGDGVPVIIDKNLVTETHTIDSYVKLEKKSFEEILVNAETFIEELGKKKRKAKAKVEDEEIGDIF